MLNKTSDSAIQALLPIALEPKGAPQAPSEINLLAVVEACQGITLRNYCREAEGDQVTCAYHRAMMELRQSIRGALSRWTLADLVTRRSSTLRRWFRAW